MLETEDRPSGIGWRPDGDLLVVAMHSRRVVRIGAEGVHPHAELGDMASFLCNDMVVAADGRESGTRWSLGSADCRTDAPPPFALHSR